MSKDLTDALRRLTEATPPVANSSYKPRRLSGPLDRPPVPAKSASAPVEKTSGKGSGGDMTEMSYSKREYHANGHKSSDGLFFMPAIKKIVTDNGTLVFAAPPASS